MLFDPGPRINIIGATAAKEFAYSAAGYGDAKYQERDSTRRINGVGAGSTPCTHVGSFLISCIHKGGTHNDLFTTNVASGPSGDHPPAILGLDSLQDKDAVVVFRRGHAQVILPGTDGCKITCGKSANISPIVNAPSGRLRIPCEILTAAASTTAFSSTTTYAIDHRGVRDELAQPEI